MSAKSKFKAKPPGPDQLWKSIIEDLWQPFLCFFFPAHALLVDFNLPGEFLDKELSNLTPPGRGRGRVADKLAKIWLRDGTEAWVLVHVEIQGKPQVDFARRMAQMGYRIFDRHGARPAALAILTDNSPDFNPCCFEVCTWGQSLRYDFTTYKVSDNPPEYHSDPTNPFALVMEAVYFSLRKHKLDDKGRLEVKEQLLQKLYATGYNKRIIFHLLTFFKYVPRFANSDFLPIFEAKIDEVKKNQPVMSTYELDLQYKFEQGIEQGIERGEQLGEEKQLEKVVRMLIAKGFSVQQINLMLEIPIEKVEAVLKKHEANDTPLSGGS